MKSVDPIGFRTQSPVGVRRNLRGIVLPSQLTVGQARVARAHYARLAELHAYSHHHATSVRRYRFAARCDRDYRRAARRCRLYGEFIRVASSAERASPRPWMPPSSDVAVAAGAL